MNHTTQDAMFSNVIVDDYDLLQKISPLSVEMSRLVGVTIGAYSEALNIVELGTGTGITTLSLLTAHHNAHIVTIDNQTTMHEKAEKNLQAWQHRLTFVCTDALNALQAMDSNSVDIIASAYTLHNFVNDYRERVIYEIFRVLKPNGQFINGDRYALDDREKHTHLIQQEVGNYFKVLIQLNKLDLLEQWIVHIFSDESEHHIMREAVALAQMQAAGFQNIQLSHRFEVNALMTATKPS
ncbi:phosphatidylethanolamine/phosphatidyl-N-methylethanolamine N-methyltransferase [Patescibacteria group bacterium]|nr:phosphatidylethanolamine/phosphatidyl-N-methylethanolamine N-methyltransferase [Patescibacteria group bacterium]